MTVQQTRRHPRPMLHLMTVHTTSRRTRSSRRRSQPCKPPSSLSMPRNIEMSPRRSHASPSSHAKDCLMCVHRYVKLLLFPPGINVPIFMCVHRYVKLLLFPRGSMCTSLFHRPLFCIVSTIFIYISRPLTELVVICVYSLGV